MKKKYYNILKKIEEKGFSAYIVGGYVRDFLLGKETSDIDIITNATPKDLSSIFNDDVCRFKGYGSLKLNIDDQIIDITTFRTELSYENGKPIIEYTSSLEDDLKRRDFLINTLVMDKEEKIIDLLDARKDIDDKIIRTVNDEDKELREDPVRILRAIRFMTSLKFKLSDTLLEYIVNHKELIKQINLVKKKEELDKIFKSDNVNIFFDFIKKYELEEVLGIRINVVNKVSSLIGIWSQVDILEDFPFTKYEKEQINEIKYLINKNKIDKIDLYKKGLYLSVIASEILCISKEKLNAMYKEIPIKDKRDIKITSKEICEYLQIKPGVKLGSILKNVEELSVNGKLKNTKEDIIEYLKKEVK